MILTLPERTCNFHSPQLPLLFVFCSNPKNIPRLSQVSNVLTSYTPPTPPDELGMETEVVSICYCLVSNSFNIMSSWS